MACRFLSGIANRLSSARRSIARLGEDRSIMRRLLACSFVTLTGLTIAAGTGCRMCASPFDYCGPVVECNNGNCGGGYHVGAAGPADGQYYENGSGPEEIQRP